MKEEPTQKLTLKQQVFCTLYSSDREFFGNGVQSYVEAYQVDKTKKNWYKNVAVSASEQLKKPYIVAEINRLLETGGLNDVAVDKQLSFLIAQHTDFGSKVQAIREYNKLKQRIIDRADVTSGGEKLVFNVVHYGDNNDTTQV
jgi:hypothetical protein